MDGWIKPNSVRWGSLASDAWETECCVDSQLICGLYMQFERDAVPTLNLQPFCFQMMESWWNEDDRSFSISPALCSGYKVRFSLWSVILSCLFHFSGVFYFCIYALCRRFYRKQLAVDSVHFSSICAPRTFALYSALSVELRLFLRSDYVKKAP